MRVLGLGGSHHDFCAALVADGQVVSAIEEERLTRVKIAYGLGPRLQRCLAAEYVLAAAGITADEVDLVVANDFVNPVYTLRLRDRVRWMGHHLAHAASTFYTSPFERAAVLVMDGRGSTVVEQGRLHGETVTCYQAGPGGLEVLRAQHGRVTLTDRRSEDPYEDSVGWMYEAVSKAIGLFTTGGMGAPGKTMGLAAYGTPRYVARLGSSSGSGPESSASPPPSRSPCAPSSTGSSPGPVTRPRTRPGAPTSPTRSSTTPSVS